MYTYCLDLFVQTARGRPNRPLYVRDADGTNPFRFKLMDSIEPAIISGWWIAGHAVGLSPSGTGFSTQRHPASRSDIAFFLNDFLIQIEESRVGRTGTGTFITTPPVYRGLVTPSFSWTVTARRPGSTWPGIL